MDIQMDALDIADEFLYHVLSKESSPEPIKECMIWTKTYGWINEYRFFSGLEAIINLRYTPNINNVKIFYSIMWDLSCILDVLYPEIHFKKLCDYFIPIEILTKEYGDRIMKGNNRLKKRQIFYLLKGEHEGKKAVLISSNPNNKNNLYVIIDGYGRSKVNSSIEVLYENDYLNNKKRKINASKQEHRSSVIKGDSLSRHDTGCKIDIGYQSEEYIW